MKCLNTYLLNETEDLGTHDNEYYVLSMTYT